MNTKTKLFNTALTLFSEKSYSASSIRDITKKAGISVSAFYNHFKSKEELLQKMYDYYIQNLIFKRLSKDMEKLPDVLGPLGLIRYINESLALSLSGEKIMRLSKVVSMEKHINKSAEEISKRFNNELFDTVLNMFTAMKKRNILKNGNTDQAAKVMGYAYIGILSDTENFHINDTAKSYKKLKESMDIIAIYTDGTLAIKPSTVK